MSDGVQRLLRIGRNVADLDRALAFYRDGLGFSVNELDAAPAWTRIPGVAAAPSRSALLSLGAQQIELTEFHAAAPYPQDSTTCDLWFQHCAIVVSDMRAAYERVMLHAATAISVGGPQTLPPSTGSVTAFKFRDPDGHPLELIAFPPGTGDPFWHKSYAAQVTLGIDHSAISVADVERSIRFYELLGFHVAARGVNHGVEQQRLDDLADVEVDVVALQPADTRTPHLELLGYRTPHGRTSQGMHVGDIAADRLVLRMQNLHAAVTRLSACKVNPAAHGEARRTGDIHGALLRDPDGHWLALA